MENWRSFSERGWGLCKENFVLHKNYPLSKDFMYLVLQFWNLDASVPWFKAFHTSNKGLPYLLARLAFLSCDVFKMTTYNSEFSYRTSKKLDFLHYFSWQWKSKMIVCKGVGGYFIAFICFYFSCTNFYVYFSYLHCDVEQVIKHHFGGFLGSPTFTFQWRLHRLYVVVMETHKERTHWTALW